MGARNRRFASFNSADACARSEILAQAGDDYMKASSGTTLSIWAATAQSPSRPPLDKDERTNVCVIGAGIAGMTTAYVLARAGKSVVVLDDGPIGGAMSGRTTAHSSPLSTIATSSLRSYMERKARG